MISVNSLVNYQVRKGPVLPNLLLKPESNGELYGGSLAVEILEVPA